MGIRSCGAPLRSLIKALCQASLMARVAGIRGAAAKFKLITSNSSEIKSFLKIPPLAKRTPGLTMEERRGAQSLRLTLAEFRAKLVMGVVGIRGMAANTKLTGFGT